MGARGKNRLHPTFMDLGSCPAHTQLLSGNCLVLCESQLVADEECETLRGRVSDCPEGSKATEHAGTESGPLTLSGSPLFQGWYVN